MDIKSNDTVILKEESKKSSKEDLGMSGIVLENRLIKHFGSFINDVFNVLGHLEENKNWIILELRNNFSDKIFIVRKEHLEKVDF